MPDFSRYNTTSNTTLSNEKLLKLSSSFRDIRDLIRQKAPGDRISRSGQITLVGDFSQNTLSFDKYSFENIIDIGNTNFNFIIKVIYGDTTSFFTSTKYKKRLVDSYSTNNPYLVLSSLAQIVTVDITPIVNDYIELIPTETEEGIDTIKNVFINVNKNSSTGERTIDIDYEELIRYLDFVVTKPSQDYNERLLPADSLIQYNNLDPSENLTSIEEEDDTTQPLGGTDTDNDPTNDGIGVEEAVRRIKEL